MKFFRKFSTSRTLKISLWGAPEAGKTTYICCLYSYLEQSNHQFKLISKDKTTTDFMNECQTFLLNGKLPNTTKYEQGATIYSFDLVHRSTDKVLAQLRIVDMAGSYMVDETLSDTYYQEVSNSDGFIILIDGDTRSKFKSSYFMLTRLLNHITPLYNEQLPELFLTVCISKMDIQSRWLHYSLLTDEKKSAYVRESILELAKDTRQQLNRFEAQNQAAFVGFSSVGRYHDQQVERSNIVRLENGYAIVKPSAWNPYNLYQPLMPILEFFGIEV